MYEIVAAIEHQASRAFWEGFRYYEPCATGDHGYLDAFSAYIGGGEL